MGGALLLLLLSPGASTPPSPGLSRILTAGLGPWGGISLLVTRGFGARAVAIPRMAYFEALWAGQPWLTPVQANQPWVEAASAGQPWTTTQPQAPQGV